MQITFGSPFVQLNLRTGAFVARIRMTVSFEL